MVLELALTASPEHRISELLSKTSSCHLQHCSKGEVFEHHFTFTPQHLSGTKKFSSPQHVKRAVEHPEGYKALKAL